MRICILGAFACSMPVIVYQIWAFIKPALNEKVGKFTGYFVISCSTALI
ncbi:MAG: twin-arginine translocase subunit TatC [Elusimicrobia bacterium]|nr:twin-arginine translocase subunit TatC [Elusimicrobiota bacterium]